MKNIQAGKIKLNFLHWLIISLFVFLCISLCFSSLIDAKIFGIRNYGDIKVLDNCELIIHYIDVGQGDAIFIEFPDNKTMLIDCGPNSGEENLKSYLANIYSKRENLELTYFVLTHQDADHVGGAEIVFDLFDVQNVYRPAVVGNFDFVSDSSLPRCTNLDFQTFITNMQNEKTEVADFKYFYNQECQTMPNSTNSLYNIAFLSPSFDRYHDKNNFDANDASAVVRIEYKNRSMLFMGDASAEVEKEIIRKYKDTNLLDVDILKIGHHGSNTSSCLDFINATSPEYAIICVGANNGYGHPADEVLTTLEMFCSLNKIFRTDKNGNIVFALDDKESSNTVNICIFESKTVSNFTTFRYYHFVVIVNTLLAMALFADLHNTYKKQK